MTPHRLILAFIYFFVLLVILPVFCSDKVYSIFYQEDPLKNQEAEVVNREHRRKGVREYLNELYEHESLSFHQNMLKQPLDNLIIVAAKNPNYGEDKVLSQLVTEIDRNIRRQRIYRNALIICNTSRVAFDELQQLSRFYPVKVAENTTKWKLFNSEEVIRHDFVDCLKQGLQTAHSKHVTIIRDLVVPYMGFLETLNQVIHHRLNKRKIRGELVESDGSWLFLHLHEPVPFRQYQFSWDCVHEVVLLAATGAVLFSVVFRYLEGPHQGFSARLTYAGYGALYFMTFALVLGRPYVTELRRFAADLYRIYDPPEPIHYSAVAFPRPSLTALLHQMTQLRCSVYSPFHQVLDSMVNTLEMPGYVLSPSLLKYTVRDLKTPTPL